MAVQLTIHYDNPAGRPGRTCACGTRAPTPSTWPRPAGTSSAPYGSCRWCVRSQPSPSRASPGAGPDRRPRPPRPPTGPGPTAASTPAMCGAGATAFVYPVRPADPQPEPAGAFLERLAADPGFPAGLLPSAAGRSGFGANPLADGRALFGLYHPTAARVFVAGSFNDWQHPGHQRPDPDAFVELELFLGWSGAANTWLAVTTGPAPATSTGRAAPHPEDAAGGRLVVDPYARQLGPDAQGSNAVVVDPTAFAWSDRGLAHARPGRPHPLRGIGARLHRRRP